MSISAAWPFAATGASISAVSITVEPAPFGLTFGAAPPTAKGVICKLANRRRFVRLVWATGAAQRGLPHEGMSNSIAPGTGTTIR